MSINWILCKVTYNVVKSLIFACLLLLSLLVGIEFYLNISNLHIYHPFQIKSHCSFVERGAFTLIEQLFGPVVSLLKWKANSLCFQMTHKQFSSFQNVFALDLGHFLRSNTSWKGAQILVFYRELGELAWLFFFKVHFGQMSLPIDEQH